MALLVGGVRRSPLPGHTSTYQVFQSLANGQDTRHKVALHSDNSTITYGQLQQMVDSLHIWLWRNVEDIAKKYGERETGGEFRDKLTTVGLCLQRSPNLVALIFAIWKLGWAYVPLDPSVPALRTLHVVRDAEPVCVVTDSNTSIKIRQLECDTDLNPLSDGVSHPSGYCLADRVLDIGDWVSNPSTAEGDEEGKSSCGEIACVLYTSGSTGCPKGVQLTMENLMNRVLWQWEELPYQQDEVCLMSKSLTFVDSVTELLGPLLAGVPVVVVREASINPELIISYVSQHRVTRLVLVPSLLKLLLLYLNTTKDSIRVLHRHVLVWIASGEILPGWLINDFFAMFPGSKFLNFYGSTEVTGDVSYYPIEEVNWRPGVKVPIGVPLANTALLVARAEEGAITLVGEDQQGEILVLGKNVCVGYLLGKLSKGDSSSFLPVTSLVVNDQKARGLLHDYIREIHREERVEGDATDTLSKGSQTDDFRRTPPAVPPRKTPPKVPPRKAKPPDTHSKKDATVASSKTCPEGPVAWHGAGEDLVLYRTGDLGRVVAGQMVFEGRRDAQVKVQGVRVHLAEVEDAVQRSGYVESHCVVAAKEQDSEDDDQVLVAFLVLKDEFEDRDTPITEDLARCLRTYLSQAVVPRLVVIDALPHLPSGKVDRQGLLRLYRRRMSHRSSRDNILILRKEEPIESRVLRIICSALGVSRCQDVLQRNFFSLGGTSISSVSVVVRLRDLGLDVTLDTFLKASTIGDVVNDILKAKTMAEVMNLFCTPTGPGSASVRNPTPSKCEEEGGGGSDEEEEVPVAELGIPALHPDIPVCPSLSLLQQQSSKGKTKGIRLAQLHTLPVSQGVDKHTVIEMVAESFTRKNPLDVTMKVPRAAHRSLLHALWPRLVQDDLSFVVKDPQRGILGAVINTDLFNEPQVRVPPSMEEIAALHHPLEEEVRHQLRQETSSRERGVRWVHNLFLATNTGLTPQDNVRLALHLEKELLKMAQSRLYHGVFTVNSNPLNQLLCENYLGYQRRGAVRVSSFIHKGRQPFASLPHDLLLVAITKTI